MDKQIKITSIILVIFALIAICVTHILIKKVTENVYKENTDKQETNLYEDKGIDLYGMYDENDLLITDLLVNFSGEEIKIPQIEGLKNKEIQEKVNKDMYERCYELLGNMKSTANDNNIEFVNNSSIKDTEIYNTYYDVMSNFSNVISIHYIVYTAEYSENLYFNYNLVTGERLKLEELFLKDTDILEIVRNAYCKRLANYSYSYEFIDDNNVAIYDENKLYKVVKGYMNTDNKEFMFSPSEIYFYFNDSSASVKLIDIADKVSIYTKYLTDESIFERNDIGRKNIFTLVNTNYDMFDSIDYGYLEDNFWYDITTSKMYFPDGQVETEKMEKFTAYVQSLKDEAYGKVNEYREKAKSNQDKFYILICTPNISMYNNAHYENGEWTYIYSNMAIANINTKVYEMPIELYNSDYKDKIIDAYRHNYFLMRGGVYYTIDEPTSGENVIYTKEEEQRKYNYMTNKEITKLSEIFYENINYMDKLEEIVRRELIKVYEYGESEAEEFLKLAKYIFEGWTIKVEIPQIEDFRLNIELEVFDKAMLNIFDEGE